MSRRLIAQTSTGLAKPRSKVLHIRPWHAHGCTTCRRRYTDACDTPMDDDVCSLHRAFKPRYRVLWDTNLDPVACCLTSAVEATHDVRERYALGGQGPWFRCSQCSRTIPYDPATYTPPPPEFTAPEETV